MAQRRQGVQKKHVQRITRRVVDVREGVAQKAFFFRVAATVSRFFLAGARRAPHSARAARLRTRGARPLARSAFCVVSPAGVVGGLSCA